MSNQNKPSKMYVKHGFLSPNEEYNPEIHFPGSIEVRNKNPQGELYYTNEELGIKEPNCFNCFGEKMEKAVCPICLEEIYDERCRMCRNRHKFHSICDVDQQNEQRVCPICRSDELFDCLGNYDNLYSGGKKTKRKNKTRKGKKKIKSNTKKRRQNKKGLIQIRQVVKKMKV